MMVVQSEDVAVFGNIVKSNKYIDFNAYSVTGNAGAGMVDPQLDSERVDLIFMRIQITLVSLMTPHFSINRRRVFFL